MAAALWLHVPLKADGVRDVLVAAAVVAMSGLPLRSCRSQSNTTSASSFPEHHLVINVLLLQVRRRQAQTGSWSSFPGLVRSTLALEELVDNALRLTVLGQLLSGGDLPR